MRCGTPACASSPARWWPGGGIGLRQNHDGLSAIGLQPRNAKIPQGKILFDGSELRGLTEDQWNQYRGRNIAMIFQEP